MSALSAKAEPGNLHPRVDGLGFGSPYFWGEQGARDSLYKYNEGS